MGEKREHRRVVGRVADEYAGLLACVEVDAELLAHEPFAHGELVVDAEPAVDVDGAHLRGEPARLHQRDDAIDCLWRQRWHVLAPIYRQVGFAVRLIGRDGAARDFAQYLLRDRHEAPAVRRARRRSVRIAADHRLAVLPVAEIERAVLADYGGNGPHARDMVAPARGPPGDRDDADARAAQALQRRIGFRG